MEIDLKNINWNKENYSKLLGYLKSLSDLKYKEFHSGITNTNLDIIGIRMPILRSIAKNINKSCIEDYFKLVGNTYYEEIMLYGLVLSNSDCVDKYLMDFIKRIDNWAICDIFCSNLKIVSKYRGKYWIYINSLIDVSNEFQTRVGIVLMMNYYLCDDYIDRVLYIVSNINSDKYYINMAISWLLSVAIINYKDKVIEIFESHKLNKFVQNKTISKIRDSYRIDKELKDYIKQFRIC